jgi:hypothetical protein
VKPIIDDIDTDPEIRKKLREVEEEQEQYIRKKIDLGEIIDFSSKNINGDCKTMKNKKQQDKQKQQSDNNNNKNNENKEKRKREFTTYKYSQMGKGDLYEAVLINDFPQFITYNFITNKIEVVDKIEENNRIITPPQKEEYPSTPYEFESVEEVYRYIDHINSNKINIDYLYNKSKSIISKYNSQEDYKLNLVSSDVIFSYFQDRFSTTHYNYFVGGNGSGKSSLADTFGAIGYRVVIMTDPTAPNLFRLLGVVEPAQCTMILEEAERIDKSEDLMAVLKTGSSFNGRVPRINTNTNKQEFFFGFCLKIIVSERSLNQSIARGVNDRTFLHKCIKGDPKYDIKEVLNPTDTGGSEKDKLLKELIDFRKLLLIYRLIHFKDPIPDLDIGIVGRDKELAKPLIQLFHNSEAQNEIIKNLQKILDLKNQKKQNTLEVVLLPIVVNLISEHGNQFFSSVFWYSLKENVSGKEDERKPNEYHTEDYGTIFRTTITNTLRDIFGVETKHTKKGSMLIFDSLVISRLTQQYNTTIILGIDKISQSYKGVIDNNNKKENENKLDKSFDKKDTSNFVKGDKVTRVTAYREEGKEKGNREVKESMEENTFKPVTYMSSPLSPCHPSEVKEELEPSPMSLIGSSYKNEQSIDASLDEIRSLISSSFYQDVLSVLERDKNQEIRELIIHNAKTIKKKSPNSDTYVCSIPKCFSGDKWFMLKHPCMNFYKQKKEKTKI